MRDQAGWAVAEASSIGCPAVVLPLGGPPLLARPNAHVASLSGDVVGNVADAVRAAAAAGGRPHDRWSIERLPARVAQWYDMAQAVQPGARRPGRPLRVLESFRSPRPTTNPYITQLHEALRARPDLRVRTFTHTRGLWGRYDLVHLHWPELFVGGHTVAGRTARRLLTVALVTRWRLTGVPIVRTVHNLERPDGLSRLDGRLLDDIDRCTLLDIRLNHHTTARPGVPATTILHGDYRRWFAQTAHAAAAQPVAGRIAYVGLVRRYKGVEGLVRAFRHMNDATATLHIAGRPSSDDLRDLLERAAKDDPRITVDPRYLDESELVEAVTSAQLVVLPYRHMHNSGTVLAALSLGRPVLVPDTAVNRALAAEVGEAWVLTFSGELSAGRLRTALTSTATLPTQPPDLSARQWESAAAAHVAAFDRARNRTARRHEDNRNVDSTLPEAIAFAAVKQYCESRSETERADIR
jgi:glycosyltransferase involved in cell wall biosynthesis